MLKLVNPPGARDPLVITSDVNVIEDIVVDVETDKQVVNIDVARNNLTPAKEELSLLVEVTSIIVESEVKTNDGDVYSIV